MRTSHAVTGGARRGLAAVLPLLAAVLLAACAGERDEPPPPEATVTTSPTATPSPPGFPMPTLPPTPLPPTPSRTAESTLTGEVGTGVEAGCILLHTELGDYLLLGEVAEDLPVGDTVTVRGQVRRDLSTICQQGTPFEVTEVLD